ncbi:hypothetical protein EGI22_14670 [Lacihabitans sp. LS3-19]|uniref:hypothetical protein n=1 Tax=Lacihabitans sp. LS3-19 TaxID=2487335 RepID=UPI0020CC9FF8|nr:hypothetical protein [Lacihabitans sp. LS3-19]MCP9769159.1 hypothetical protein [Lacihabitans sp. LS3-19]
MDPIDKLFSDKLKNHEVQPSDRANILFLSKIEKKEEKKKPLFWWTMSLAASLLIVGFAGFYFYSSKKQNTVDLAQNTEKRQEDVKLSENAEIQNSTLPKSQENVLEPLKEVGEKGFSKSVTVKHTSKIVEEQDLVVSDKSSQLSEYQPTKEVLKSVQIAKIDEKAQVASAIVPNQETLIFLTPMLAMNGAMNPHQKALTMKALQSNSENKEDYFSEEKSLFVRVIDEVKNLKKGEKVDFNKLGFKPIEELALNQDGFIVSESHQIKEKLNWIKSRLNNN